MINCFCVLQPPLTIDGICVTCYRPAKVEVEETEEQEVERELVLA